MVNKSLRKATKGDKLLEIFSEVGTQMKVKEVMEITGISSYNSLKALFSYIRHSEHVQEENRIDVKIKEEVCTRVK